MGQFKGAMMKQTEQQNKVGYELPQNKVMRIFEIAKLSNGDKDKENETRRESKRKVFRRKISLKRVRKR